MMCHLCAMWLSNGSEVGKSPLLNYLIDAEHEKVNLQNDVHVGKTVVECEMCGHFNNLIVAFASVEANSAAVVLSRQTNEPCNRKWKKLDDERYFLSFMVKIPGASFKKGQSEKQRICMPHCATMINSCNKLVDGGPQTVPLQFTNGTEYESIFIPLIKLESDSEKSLAESTRKSVNITLRWKDSSDNKVEAFFFMPHDEAVWKIRKGDKVKLRRTGDGINCTGFGRIIKVPDDDSEEVGVRMDTNVGTLFKYTTGFVVTRVWTSVSFDRMKSAVKKFASQSSTNSNILNEQILGTSVNNHAVIELNNAKLYPIPNFPTLSKVQETAVKHAVQHPLTLIQGPSASGKTITLLNIVYNFVQLNKGPILVCAPTNTVVDYLALSINQIKLNVVRLHAEYMLDQSPTKFLSLDSKLRNHYSTAELKRLEKICDADEVVSKDAKKIIDAKKATECNILNDADVICCTCIAAADERLASMKFHAILIDESMQATEPEIMIPIVLGCQRLVLVGDHLQLNPVIHCEEAREAGLKRSLFQRLVDNGVKPLQMTVQYRMHPNLWHFPSKFIYDGSLPNGVSAAQRKLPDQAFPWPVTDFPLMFYDVRSSEERTWPVISYVNRKEASVVEKLVTHLLKRGISPDRIGIITQYEGQKKYLMKCMEMQGPLDTNRYRKIEVNKVDAFQGREKDIIIISCVRSQGTKGVGSLNYVRRLNLVLTRAKYGLIIVGNPVALSKMDMWKNLLIFCKQQSVLVEGDKLDSLKESKYYPA